eukprot:m.146572 g.146572  ORF g.146572 m.146572 type:complete len:547 (+) comp13236_c0_seq1:56-1696(+)
MNESDLLVNNSSSDVVFAEDNGGDNSGGDNGDVIIELQGTKTKALRATLTMWNGVTFIVGTMIGSGIFASPGSVLLNAHSVGLSLIAWVMAGLIAMMGSASYAELGTLLKASGGEYVYIQAGISEFLAFLFSWASCLITRPGSLAIITLIAGEYFVRPFFADSPPLWISRTAAVFLNSIILIINVKSVRLATKVQTYFTTVKIVVLIIFSFVGFVYLCRDVEKEGTNANTNVKYAFRAEKPVTFGTFGLAVVSALWAYDGWNNLNFITAELKHPEKDLPRALFIGMPLVTCIYAFANLAYFSVLPLSSIANFDEGEPNESFATEFAFAVMKGFGKVVFPLCIAASAFSSANGSQFTGSRLVRESALGGHFPRVLGGLWGEGDAQSPGPALLSQYVISCLMILGGDFDALVAYFSAAAWFFYLAATISLLRLRFTMKNTPRPYRVPTVIPVVFSILAFSLMMALVIQSPANALVSLGFVFSGIPFYYGRPLVNRFVPFLAFELSPRRPTSPPTLLEQAQSRTHSRTAFNDTETEDDTEEEEEDMSRL